MKLCWLVPDDRGGGVVSVAQECCQQLSKFGYNITLLFALTPTGRIKVSPDFCIDSLDLVEPAEETPNTLLKWLKNNPQDVLFLNGCEQADLVIPFLPENLYCIYVVHDTASRYWKTVIKQEHNLDGIIAVSETISCQFSDQLKEPDKLSVILNGCSFPDVESSALTRSNDIIFLGGDKPIKGAFDVINLWHKLMQSDFPGKLHWFGKLTPDFQQQILRLPSSEKIHLYGQAPRDLVFSMSAKSKVLLMLSRVEPFGMATIEAMSMGCVPIAWDIETGTKEIIGESNMGIFVPLGNTKVLAAKVQDILDSHAELEFSVMHHARTHFSAEVMGRRYEAFIQSLSSRPPIKRSKSGQCPPAYQPPIRKFQLLPSPIRSAIRHWVGRSPNLGYLLRDLRGF